MGTINPGFWVTKFIVHPNEFEVLVRLAVDNGIEFHESTYGSPKHDLETVCQKWRDVYEWVMAPKKPDRYSGGLSYSLSFRMTNGDQTAFSLQPFALYFMFHHAWAEDKIPLLQLSCCKGFSVDKVDEKGPYFVYEDVNLHEPELYPKYELLANYVKTNTKPLRFKTWTYDEFIAFKPPVRISQRAANDLKESWFFKKYGLEMLSFTPRANAVLKSGMKIPI